MAQRKQQIIKAGSVFAVPLSEKEYFFFRVILDIEAQWMDRSKTSSDSTFQCISSCCLIEVFESSAPTIEEFTPSNILIPGLTCSFKSFVETEKWLYVGNIPVEVTEIYFPGFIQSAGMQNGQFVRGEVAIEFPMRANGVEEIGVFPQSFPGAGLKVLYLYNAGRKREIPDTYEDVDRFDLSKKDLYFSKYLDEMRKHVGADIDLSYFELSRKYGFDLERFYK